MIVRRRRALQLVKPDVAILLVVAIQLCDGSSLRLPRVLAAMTRFWTSRPPRNLRILLMFFVALAVQPQAVALTPLNDLGAGLYLNQFQGGLYPTGSNLAPAAHAAEGLARAASVQPLNTQGQPDPNGKYVFISIGMSNTTQEFCSQGGSVPCGSWTFMGQAASSSAVNQSTLYIVNGAEGGKSAAYWDTPTDPDYDRIVTDWLNPNGLSEKQVQAAWVKVANPNPTSRLPNANSDAYRLVDQMGDIARALKVRYPNLQQVFFSSRIYAGYASTTLNPEPYAYESGLAVKWLIEAQINQMNGGGIDSRAGDLNYTTGVAPWLAWGPYLWADGLNPRSDGLIWQQQDFQSDGTHPAQSGEQKVGAMLLNFMLNSEFTQEWFPIARPGDYNRNGTVDAGDYISWRKALGSTYNQNHYVIWRTHFGESPGSGSGASATVSEPATAMLLILVTFSGCLRQGGRRRPNHASTPDNRQQQTQLRNVSTYNE
jgi:hypothetical protein